MEFPGSTYKVPQGLFSLSAGIDSRAIQPKGVFSTRPLLLSDLGGRTSFDWAQDRLRYVAARLSFDKLRTWLRMLS